MEPRRPQRFKPSALAGQMEQLRALVTAQPDLTLAELRQALGGACSLPAVWRALRRLHLTRKKVLYAQEQTRPDVVATRQHWRPYQSPWAVSRLVFLDESGFTTKLTRAVGASPARPALRRPGSPRALADDDLRRCPPGTRAHRAAGP